MATTTEKNIIMRLLKEDSSKKNFTVKDYREGVTDAEIKAAANGIVEEDIFAYDGVGLTGVHSIQKVTTTTTEVEMG